MTLEREPRRLSRRSALTGAAWSAPVIVVASAAPAYATSIGSSFDIKRGSSAAVLTTDGITTYWDMQFSGLSVLVPAALSGGQLTLTVTFTPTTLGGPNVLQVFSTPAGWAVSPTVGNTGTSVVFTYGAAVPAQTEIQVQSGIHVGAQQAASLQTGTYVVTASAPGQSPDPEPFPTGSGSRPARGVEPIRRPTVP